MGCLVNICEKIDHDITAPHTIKQQSDRWRSWLLSQSLVIRIEVPDGLWLTTIVFVFLNNQLWLSDFSLCLLHEHWQQCLEKEWQKWGVIKFVKVVRKLCWPSWIESAAEILAKDGSSKVAWPLKSCNVSLFVTCLRATMKIKEFLRVAGYLYACIWYTISVTMFFNQQTISDTRCHCRDTQDIIGRIRLSVSTVNRTDELSGMTHATPFCRYGKHSTGPGTYGLWVRTYSKLFCKSIFTVCSYWARSNEICTYGSVSRGSIPRVRVRLVVLTDSRIRL